jgi:hypothetical protein
MARRSAMELVEPMGGFSGTAGSVALAVIVILFVILLVVHWATVGQQHVRLHQEVPQRLDETAANTARNRSYPRPMIARRRSDLAESSRVSVIERS